jgi:Na+/proline symporter
MSCGAIISAPALVFSAIFGWNLPLSVALFGVQTVVYTMIGGVQAVAWADVKQMVLIVCALLAILVVLLIRIPVSPIDALEIAGAGGRLRVFDFTPTLNQDFTVWSGVIGGAFLMLSYFGTDQSQVQRYLTARSVDEARSSLLMSAYWKIPLQALVLLMGVGVFVFYQFQTPPLLYNPQHDNLVREREPAAYAALQTRYSAAVAERQVAARGIASASDGDGSKAASRDSFRQREADVSAIRKEALSLAERVTGQTSRDVNYIIPRFVLGYLPVGLVGIFIAGVLAAAMGASAAELNALSTATIIDFYRRWIRREGSDAHFLRVSKLATAFWGIFACVVATYAANLGSLIVVVNRFGSFFYGSILGVFLLAMMPMARGIGAFIGLIAGMCAVGAVNFGAPSVSFLWHNVIGAVTVVAVGLLLSVALPRPVK